MPILFAAQEALVFVSVGITVFVLIVMLVLMLIFAQYFRWWIQSFLTGAGISLWDLIGMTFRKVNIGTVVKAKIMAVQAGLGNDPEMTTRAFEAHQLSGGNIMLVIRALINANKAKIVRLSYREATAIDLAGRNVLEAVQTSVNPKVIDCPARGSGKESLDAVAKNGIQLKVRTRVTVRANLQQLIGGANRAHDPFTDAGDDRLLRGPTDQLLQVGPHRHSRADLELNTVLGDGIERFLA